MLMLKDKENGEEKKIIFTHQIGTNFCQISAQHAVIKPVKDEH